VPDEKNPRGLKKNKLSALGSNRVIGHFGKYHNTLCLSRQILHKYCFCFRLGPLQVAYYSALSKAWLLV